MLLIVLPYIVIAFEKKFEDYKTGIWSGCPDSKNFEYFAPESS